MIKKTQSIEVRLTITDYRHSEGGVFYTSKDKEIVNAECYIRDSYNLVELYEFSRPAEMKDRVYRGTREEFSEGYVELMPIVDVVLTTVADAQNDYTLTSPLDSTQVVVIFDRYQNGRVNINASLYNVNK